MADGFDGLPELIRAFEQLPDRVQNRIAKMWTKKWSQQAWRAAISAAPVGKTRRIKGQVRRGGNLVAGIVRRDSGKGTLGKLKSLARSVVIGKKPAFHFHLVVLGTKPRYTKGGMVGSGKKKKRASLIQRLLGNKGSKPAFRGVMPKNDFMARAALPLMGPAEQDLRVLVQKNVTRLLRR